MFKPLKLFLLIISLIFLFYSLTQECYTINGQPSIGSFGFVAFIMGLMNNSATWFCWLANPFFILTCIFVFNKEKLALLFGFTAFICSLSFYLLDEVVINEAGTIGKIDSYLLGYWLWFVGITVMFLTALLSYIIKKDNRKVLSANKH